MKTELTQKEENELAMRIEEQLSTDEPAKVSRVIAIVLDIIFGGVPGQYRAVQLACPACEGDDEKLLQSDGDTRPIVSAEEAGNAELDSDMGNCSWCRQCSHEPFSDHCYECEVLWWHCAGSKEARKGEANNDDDSRNGVEGD